MQAEIKRINDENQRQKAERLAQEKLADQMVMEFTKKKMVGTWRLRLGPVSRSDVSTTNLSNNGTLAEDSCVFILKYIVLVSFLLHRGQMIYSISLYSFRDHPFPQTRMTSFSLIPSFKSWNQGHMQ